MNHSGKRARIFDSHMAMAEDSRGTVAEECAGRRRSERRPDWKLKTIKDRLIARNIFLVRQVPPLVPHDHVPSRR